MTAPGSALRVAVVIPVHVATYLSEALDSVFAQSRQPDEVIVVDDGSPDPGAVTQATAKYDDRVTLIRQSNQGWPAARNAAHAATRADLVAMLDADDVWLPDFLREQLIVFAEHPHVDLVYSDGLFVGRTGLAGRRFMDACPSLGPVTFENLITQRCTVLLSSVVARRRALIEAGGFARDIRRGADFDMWLRMARRGAGLSANRKVLVLYRIHEANVSGSDLNQVERPLRILERLVTTTPLSPRESAMAHERIRYLRGDLAREQGKELLSVGNYEAARREFARARHVISSWKLRAAVLGLRVAPQLVRSIFLKRRAALAAQRAKAVSCVRRAPRVAAAAMNSGYCRRNV